MIQEILESFILLSLQYLCVPSPTLTKHRLIGLASSPALVAGRSYETNTEQPLAFALPVKQVADHTGCDVITSCHLESGSSHRNECCQSSLVLNNVGDQSRERCGMFKKEIKNHIALMQGVC
jgi:hypothetical protein